LAVNDSYHMPLDEFRRHGHALVEWVANYLETVEQRPVQPPVFPGQVRAQLPAHPPEQPESLDAVLADLDAYRAVAATPAAAVALESEARELHRLRATIALRLVARLDAWLRRRPVARRLLRAATRGATHLIGGVTSGR